VRFPERVKLVGFFFDVVGGESKVCPVFGVFLLNECCSRPESVGLDLADSEGASYF